MATADQKRVKRVLGLALGLFAFVSLLAGIMREVEASRMIAEKKESGEQQEVAAEAVTLYYFHGNKRCTTCKAIESETKRIVKERFSDEVERGALVFEVVNFDQPEHRHYQDDYDLAFGTVLVRGPGTEPALDNLEDIWMYIEDPPPAFENYVVEHVEAMLGGER